MHGHVSDHHLEVLGDLHVVHGKINGMLHQFEGSATGVTEDRKAGHAQLARTGERLDDVGRIAAARKSDKEVLRLSEDRELLGKDILVGDVVGETGEDRGIGGEGCDAQAPTGLFVDAIEEIIRQMDRIGGTAAVATKKDLTVFPPAKPQGFDERDHIAPVMLVPDGVQGRGILRDKIGSGRVRRPRMQLPRRRGLAVVFRKGGSRIGG